MKEEALIDSEPFYMYTVRMMRSFHRFGLCVLFLYSMAMGCTSVDPGVMDVSLPRKMEIMDRSFPWTEPTYRPKELKKLRVGMTKSEVLSLFQEPKSIKRTPSDEYWEYDWFELYFRGGRLVNWFDL